MHYPILLVLCKLWGKKERTKAIEASKRCIKLQNDLIATCLAPNQTTSNQSSKISFLGKPRAMFNQRFA